MSDSESDVSASDGAAPALDISVFRGHGRSMKDVPRRVRRAARDTFTIPVAVSDQILPAATLSIPELTRFPLPLLSTNANQKSPAEFFSRYEPEAIDNAKLLRLRRVVLPAEPVIRKLVESSRQAWLDGFCSVTYAHIDGATTRYPLWVISFWMDVLELKKTAWARWTKALTFLDTQARKAKAGTERAELLAEARLLLSMISWGSAKPAGLENTEPFHSVWRLVGPHWLADSQINDLLELLRQKIENEVDGGRFRVKSALFMQKLAEAYELGSDSYNSESRFRWLREIGEELADDNGTLVSIVHLAKIEGNPHWTSLVMEFAADGVCVRYGDSFKKPIPAKLREICEWWVLVHTGRGIRFEEMPIGQQDDGFSCGMLALNSVQHYLDATIPLTKRGESWIVARLETFNALAKWTLEQLEAERMEVEEEEEARRDAYQPPSLSYQPLSSAAHLQRDPDPADLAGASNYAFSFVAPSPLASRLPSSSTSSSRKRPRHDPDAPSPQTTPERRRIYKCSEEDTSNDVPPPAFLFGLKTTIPDPPAVDVFGPSPGTPTPVKSSGVAAPNPTRSPITSPSHCVLPPDERADAKYKGTIRSFFKIETPEERAIRQERESREYRETSEIRAQNAKEAIRIEREQRLARQAEYMRGYRAQKRDERIAKGDIPKRGRKRKAADADLEDHGINESNPRLAEYSRPFRQFAEEAREGNKPSGRKRLAQNIPSDAVRMRWQAPLIWQQCLLAVEKARWPWRPCDIVREAQKINKPLFSRLTTQVVGRWIDRGRTTQKGGVVWTKEVERSLALQSRSVHGPGRVGILTPYPETRKTINTQLTSLRAAGIPVNLLTARGLMVAHIEHNAPHLFQQAVGNNNAIFRCSESFVRNYLRGELGWSERRATKAAQKLPANYEKVLEDAYIREAWLVHQYKVPAELRVNTDQTQVVYAQGSASTWNKRGAKQVAAVGLEEKRAFTLVPSISASGDVLPAQVIYGGKTDGSAPSVLARGYAEATAAGHTFIAAGVDSYWSNHKTMHKLVNKHIAPYFARQKELLQLPPSQVSIWKIDCWSVHRSKEFVQWMQKKHPNIALVFVPGGCTGVWQPLDVAVQRPTKLSIKRSAHRDIVNEALQQIADGASPARVKLDTTIGTLRNRSVMWVLQAMKDIAQPDLIKKAFEMCAVGDRNCSQESLTSPATVAMLRRLSKEQPELHAELTRMTAEDAPELEIPEAKAVEEEPYSGETVYDDCDTPIAVAVAVVRGKMAAGFELGEDGGIQRSADAETLDGEAEEQPPAELGRGKRARQKTKRYSALEWEEH